MRLGGPGATARGQWLILPNARYIEQRSKYDSEVKRAGMSAMHGLRHGYAQSRYHELIGRLATAVGRPEVRKLCRGP